MPTLHADPSTGDDSRDGLSPGTALRTLAELTRRLATLGHVTGTTIALRGGATFPGTLAFVGGDPDRPVNVETYEREKGLATIQSGTAPALQIYGPGGVTVRRLRLVGYQAVEVSGLSIENGHLFDGPARDITVENMAATGYGAAGIRITPFSPMTGVRVQGCRTWRNGVGLVIGDRTPGRYMMRDVHISRCDSSDNDWEHGPAAQAGYGLALNGVEGGTVSFSCFNGNGRRSMNPGHAGVEAGHCARLTFTCDEFSDNHDPNPAHGDGSGLILNECIDCDVADCIAERNAGGFGFFSEGAPDATTGEQYATQGVRALRCVARENVAAFSVINHVSDLWLVDCAGTARASAGQFRKIIDVQDHVGDGVRVVRGRFEAEAEDGGIAWLIQLTAARSRIAWHGPTWVSSDPQYMIEGTLYRRFRAWETAPI